MAYEVFTAAPWAENDPGAYIIYDPNAVPVGTLAMADTNAPADSDQIAILYKDAGAGHFVVANGWTHLFELRYTDTTGNGKCFTMCYTNTIEDMRSNKNNTQIGCGLQMQSDGQGNVDINVFTDGSNTRSNGVVAAFPELTWVYGKAIMSSQGILTFEFYSDTARTSLLASDSLDIQSGNGSEPASYQYVYAMSNENRGSTGREWGFDIRVDLNEVTYQVSETFKKSNGTLVPDGTKIVAFDSTNDQQVGSGTTVSGVATFTVSTSNTVYLVADPSALGGETVCTTLITPTAV